MQTSYSSVLQVDLKSELSKLKFFLSKTFIRTNEVPAYKFAVDEYFENEKPYNFLGHLAYICRFWASTVKYNLDWFNLTRRFLNLYLLSVAVLLSFWPSLEGGVTVRTSFKVDPTTINLAPLHKCDCRNVAWSSFISPVKMQIKEGNYSTTKHKKRLEMVHWEF